MCEHYLDICDEEACVLEAKERAEAFPYGSQYSSIKEEYFQNRSGKGSFLWKGYSSEPCEHIKTNHGPKCNVVEKHETKYGLYFDTCNCENNHGEWVYY